LTTAPHPPDAVVVTGTGTVIAGGATGVPAVQTPLSHESPVVQTLGVLHEVPSGTLGLLHAPVAGLHVPAEWHWSRATQRTALLPTQLPAPSHAYVSLHKLLPKQVAPLGVGAHVPSEPGRLHALHDPQELAVVLQHTPSTQVPAAHSPEAPQTAPNGGGVTFTLNEICA
jgi:hypothetical protein